MVASFSVCLVFLAVFLPTFFHLNKPNESVYFAADSVYSEDILDINEFVTGKNLNVKYLVGNAGGDNNAASYLIESKKFVFLLQQLLFMTDDGFDIVDLGIVPSNDTFEKFKDFEYCDEKVIIENISIDYIKSTKDSQTMILAKFNYKKINYFLKIATATLDEKLDNYIKLLLA